LGLSTSGVYLYTNSLAPAKGYELIQLQVDYEDLQSDLRKLDRQVIEAQSFINLQQSDVLHKMHVAQTHDLSYVEGGNVAENITAPTSAND
jgi:hypothetical protein